MRAFELALHPAKTRLIRFGRYAAKQREKLGEGKPETFDFLGFTHFCTRSCKWGSFVIGRKTIKKRMRAKLKAIKVELRKCMHDPIVKTGAWVTQMLQGHLNYFAVSGNDPSQWWFFKEVRWRWLKSLKRRSQNSRLTWEKFTGSWTASFRRLGYYIQCPATASTPQPEGGARCVSSARRDLCGGRGAILVPTATLACSTSLRCSDSRSPHMATTQSCAPREELNSSLEDGNEGRFGAKPMARHDQGQDNSILLASKASCSQRRELLGPSQLPIVWPG